VRGDAEGFPRKAGRRPGKLRRGAAFVALRADGRILLRTREPRGLLGGMTEVPTSEWTEEFDRDCTRKAAPRLTGARWQRVPGMVTHTFTHFPLALAVHVARLNKATKAPAGMRWVALADLAEEALPNVMRKVVAHALDRMPARTQQSDRATINRKMQIA
jgi:A/G-specific adenine glycosylase